MFIIIDNFQLSNDADLKSWIETVQPPSEILITSSKDVGFTNVYHLTGLSPEDFRKFIHQEAEMKDMDIDKLVTPHQLENIYTFTWGNPLAILLVLGLLKNKAYKNDMLILPPDEICLLFDILYTIAYKGLSREAKKLLDFFPLLAEKTSIEREALKEISDFEWECFHKCIVELSAWNLIYFDLEDRYYRLHPTLIQYLQDKETSTPIKLIAKTKNLIKERYIKYYLTLVETNIKRNYPNEDYWNCLVSPKMAVLDTRVSSILKAVEWAEQISSQHGNYLKLIKYLIHYLDSRFYNRSRMEFVKRAIGICEATGDWYLEALFKIDALGWTCVEENQLKLAEQNILAGCSILEAHSTDKPQARRVDLKALAQAWLARVKLEQYKKPEDEKLPIEDEKLLIEAEKLIEEALLYTGGRPWIQYRIYMVSGDISYRKQEFYQSLKYYKLAKNEINSYGGEGGNYQINPRLGLAYLSIGTERYLQEAENIFTALKQNHNILIGKLYGEFGLAMIDYKRGNRHETKKLVAKLEGEITKRSPDNLLLKLIKLYKSETLDKDEN
ncbi:MAG: ATP-binding protein [Chitinophagaceae bacterium]|nr:ATP-binding protein [Chitinophagaceae bacterium]